MLTMVSIDATGELNEELSESWSLAKKSLSWPACKRSKCEKRVARVSAKFPRPST
jgi:hypothetical protein